MVEARRLARKRAEKIRLNPLLLRRAVSRMKEPDLDLEIRVAGWTYDGLEEIDLEEVAGIHRDGRLYRNGGQRQGLNSPK